MNGQDGASDRDFGLQENDRANRLSDELDQAEARIAVLESQLAAEREKVRRMAIDAAEAHDEAQAEREAREKAEADFVEAKDCLLAHAESSREDCLRADAAEERAAVLATFVQEVSCTCLSTDPEFTCRRCRALSAAGVEVVTGYPMCLSEGRGIRLAEKPSTPECRPAHLIIHTKQENSDE